MLPDFRFIGEIDVSSLFNSLSNNLQTEKLFLKFKASSKDKNLDF